MNNFLLAAMALLTLAFFSCENLDDYTVHHEFEVLKDSCVNTVQAKAYYGDSTNIHITNEASYDTLRNFCPSTLPDVDFEEFDVIGRFSTVQACGAEYRRRVLENTHSGTINLNVDITTLGDCRTNFDSWNLVVLPKLAEDQQIKVNINTERGDSQ